MNTETSTCVSGGGAGSQIPLFRDPVQDRRLSREPKRLYEMIVSLRKRGVLVYRHGLTQHIVDSMIMTDTEFRRFFLKKQKPLDGR